MTIRVTAEQLGVILRPEPLLGVKGCAGSGKSLVAMLRAIHQHLQDESAVLVLAYNKPLVAYLRGLARANRLEYDVAGYGQMSLDAAAANAELEAKIASLPTDLSEFDVDDVVHFRTYDSVGHELLRNGEVEFSQDDAVRDQALQAAAETVGAERDSGIVRRIRKLGLVGAASLEEAREFDPSFRRLVEETQRRVWGARTAYVQQMDADARINDFDEIPLAVRRLIERNAVPAPDRTYRHVVLDEVQDFTPAWLRLVRRHVAPERDGHTLTVVGDVAQTLYPRLGRRTALPRAELGFATNNANTPQAAVASMPSTSFRLERNPAAKSLAHWWYGAHIDGRLEIAGRDRPSPPATAGIRQSLTSYERHADGLDAETKAVVDRAARMRSDGTVAILLPVANSWKGIARWRAAVDACGVPARIFKEEAGRRDSLVSFWGHDERSPIWFVSYRLAKGIEWDYVFVPRLSEWGIERGADGFGSLGQLSIEESSGDLRDDSVSVLEEALYVAFTRARRGLYLSSQYRPTRLLEGAPVEVRHAS